MANTTVSDMCDATSTKLNLLMETYREKSKEAFNNLIKVFFDEYPQVKTIYWSQYVPGFNDGDPCEFSINDIAFSPCDWQEIDGPNFGYEVDEKDREDFSYSTYQVPIVTDFMKDMRKISTFLHSIPDHLERTFESNAFVRIHRDGIEVDDYDCGY